MQRVVGRAKSVVACTGGLLRARTFPPSFVRTMSYGVIQRGSENTLDYRVYFTRNGSVVSPFHDIPLLAQNDDKKVYNMVVEVPRWTNAKMEIATKEPMSPIKQDVKKGKLRYVKNCFPHHGYIWNYGFLPQTWENPSLIDSHTGCKGDGDPIDVCEIGQKVHSQGDVVQVKALCTVALIDEGETDWKILAIDVTDPLADQLNDLADIEKNMPGLLKATVEWFTIYKIPDGKPANKFAFNGQAKSREFAEDIVDETNKQWKALVDKKVDDTHGMDCKNVTVSSSPYKVDQSEADGIAQQSSAAGPAAAISSEVDKWYYVSASSA